MERIQRLLPTATIVVDAVEKLDYLAEVDGDRLVTHPGRAEGISGLPKVYNWLIDNFTEETLVEIDDDLQAVKIWCGEGSRRVWQSLKNPDDILQIIENGVTIANDLDISTFSWSKTQNAAFGKPDHKPITATGLVANVFGVRGTARNRPYDPEMIGRASPDWTLKTLLEDRFVMIDKRVFFDCGKIFSGSGGNSGSITPEKFRKSTKQLKDRWGKHLSFGGVSGGTGGASGNKKKSKEGALISSQQGDRMVSVRVSRHNSAATR
jgi:hypothetical protein